MLSLTSFHSSLEELRIFLISISTNAFDLLNVPQNIYNDIIFLIYAP